MHEEKMIASLEGKVVRNPQSSDSEDDIVIRKKPAYKKFVESSSDDEGIASSTVVVGEVSAESCSDEDNKIVKPVAQRKGRILIRSESESSDKDDVDVIVTEPAESVVVAAAQIQQSNCIDPPPEKCCEESNHDNLSLTKDIGSVWYKNSALYDAESSEDEATDVSWREVCTDEVSPQERELTAPGKKTKQPRPKSSGKISKKPSKTDSSEVQKIYSESQRMLRETKLSLPYHKPRQRTLTEFLQRRRSLPPMPKSLKVSNEQMKVICKQLEEREKEAREFFKSESEESDVGEVQGSANDSENNENSLNKLCLTSEKTSEGKNEVIPVGSGDKTKGTPPNMDNCNAKEVESERISSSIEEHNENETSNNAKPCNVLGNELSSCEVSIQDASKCPTDGVQLPQNLTLKLFGSCVEIGSSNSTREILAVDEQATNNKGGFIDSCTDRIDGISAHNAFKPSLSECSQAALDCVYDETVVDGLELKKSVPVPATEIPADSELDSQALVLRMSEGLDKTEESPNSLSNSVTKQRMSNCLEVSNIEEGDHVHLLGKVKSGWKNDQECEKHPSAFASLSNRDYHDVGSSKVFNFNAVESDVMEELTVQNLQGNAGSDTHAVCGKGKVESNVMLPDEVVSICNENSQIEKQQNSPGSNIEVDSSQRACVLLGDNVGSNSNLEVSREPNEINKCRTGRKGASMLGGISNFQPRLTGESTDIIDLEVVPKPAGIRKLIERFMKHSSAKKKPQHKKQVVELGVVSAEKGPDGLESVKKDIVLVTLEGDGEGAQEDMELARPGAKLRKLKQELQQQIARQREEEWTKKMQEGAADGETPANEKGFCSPYEEEVEEEMTESETEDEEEEEMDDLMVREKKRTKSAFVDDEAELSDDDGNAADVSSDEDEDGEEGSSESENDGDENDKGNEARGTAHENEDSEPCISGSAQSKPRFQRLRLMDTLGSNDDSSDEAGIEDTCPIPAYQPGGGMKSDGGVVAPLNEEFSSQHHFLSPIFSLPIRSSRPSSIKSVMVTPGTPNSRQTTSSAENTPHVNRGQSRLHLTQKKLFVETDSTSTQENVAELVGLCSGKFGDIPGNEIENLANPLGLTTTPMDHEAELLGLCSGKFESQAVHLESLEGKDEWKDTTDPSHSQLPDGDSQDLRLTLSEDVLSPVKPDPYKIESTPQALLDLVSSDEEDSLLKERTKIRKAKNSHKKLAFSDDENENVDSTQPLLAESVSDEGETRLPGLVEYDSEENEVSLTVDRRGEGVRVRSTTEFFEDEAELSESEWGSADEDERGLDDMDSEEGDEERLDTKKVKEQLDKIHMRRMMDDDNREVRLLQELLFEDGELHSEGGGRERKFRWKNIDKLDENYQPPDPGDEDVYEVDDETEEQWRRMRYQREKFLLELQAKGGVVANDGVLEDDDGDGSQLMKLGKAALKRLHRSNSQNEAQEKKHEAKHSVADSVVSPDPKRQFQLLVKRGSFLARGETALARLAQLTRGAADQNINGPKNSRNFVFAVISPEKEDNSRREATAQAKVNKRKSVEGTPPVMKKLRLSEEMAKGRCLLDHLVP